MHTSDQRHYIIYTDKYIEFAHHIFNVFRAEKIHYTCIEIRLILLYLTLNVSLYGIGVDDTSFEMSDYGTVLTLAQRYVGFIQKLQPSGPYYLRSKKFYRSAMDDSSYRLNFDLGKKNEIHHHS